MTTTQSIITIVAVVLGTMATRFLPLVISLLIIYCLKDVPANNTHGLPEAIAILFVIVLHKWKKSTLLSIAGGTILYMILVQRIL